MLKKITTAFFFAAGFLGLHAQTFTLEGTVINQKDSLPVPFAAVVLGDNMYWAISGTDGGFQIKNISQDETGISVRCLGFASYNGTVTKDSSPLTIRLKEDNLRLSEVIITAQKSRDTESSFILDQKALDHRQVLNAGDAAALLPGGKTVNPSLTNDSKILLHASAGENGNPAFATAIEIDGARISGNAIEDGISGASLRSFSTSNIETIEIITGIPSVEYGDLSNGIVKISTKKGKTPFIIDAAANPHTKLLSVSKGFGLPKNAGVLNAAFERAKSFTDIVSPYTAYARNTLDLKYSGTFNKESNPLTFTFELSGNTGGYSSKDDPDSFSEDYEKLKDNRLRVSAEIKQLLNKRWITNFQAFLSASFSDKTKEKNIRESRSSTQPYIHTKEEGYFMAETFDENPSAPVILSPTGYWHVKSFSESKPFDLNIKIKGDKFWYQNKITAGAEYTTSCNFGKGLYYNDLKYAPTWRERSLKSLPTINTTAAYIEDKFETPVFPRLKGSSLRLTFGIREDLTMISKSVYGTVSSLSPRGNAKLTFWNDNDKVFKQLSLNFGIGKSVKLPSFAILYPEPQYYDENVFSSPSEMSGTAFYAVYNRPFSEIRNKDLKYQSAIQYEIGTSAEISGVKFYFSVYYNKTKNPYILNSLYTPFTYYKSTLENSAIKISDRIYTIDRHSGIVTVSDKTGAKPSETLPQTPSKIQQRTPFYGNADPLTRCGADWILDFPQIRILKTTVQLDGNLYRYKAVNQRLAAYNPPAVNTDGTHFNFVGYYAGTQGNYFNGKMQVNVNQNVTLTTHIPKIGMVISLRVESTLYRYSHAFIESDEYQNIATATKEKGEVFGIPYEKNMKDYFVTVYPAYYSAFENPDEKIPFYEKFLWAKDNDTELYEDLKKLTVTSNYSYNINPEKISAYYSANFNITKEISDLASISFYANNFFCHNGVIKNSKTGLKSTLYDAGYIPKFYYGMTVRIKI
jgi:hypothetical protein